MNESRFSSRRIAVPSVLVVGLSLCLIPGHDASGANAIDHRMYEASPVWPLCGRINENPPANWSAADGCPLTRWGNPDHADFPLRYGYGPRVLTTENRFDFHPGIDIPTPSGTPIFAMADGIVRTVRVSAPKVEIQHYRPGSWGGDCTPGGCYHTIYNHLQSAIVSENQRVVKGQLIGYSGASQSGFQHLHFEIRDADPSDPRSNWMHDAVHPLRILPYRPVADGTQLSITNVDASDSMNPQVTVQLVQAAGATPADDKRTFDINQVELQVFDNRTRAPIPQPGNVAASGYHLHPSRADFDLHTHQYVHKDGGNQPWESFTDCPFAGEHGASYNSEVHIGQTDPNDTWTGLFNGVAMRPDPILDDVTDYKVVITFKEILGSIDADDLCIVVNAKDVRGAQAASPATWNCTF